MNKEDKFEFDESDQAALFAHIKLPEDWYDKRPFEERFKNFGLLVPKGNSDEPPPKIDYIPKNKKP